MFTVGTTRSVQHFPTSSPALEGISASLLLRITFPGSSWRSLGLASGEWLFQPHKADLIASVEAGKASSKTCSDIAAVLEMAHGMSAAARPGNARGCAGAGEGCDGDNRGVPCAAARRRAGWQRQMISRGAVVPRSSCPAHGSVLGSILLSAARAQLCFHTSLAAGGSCGG